MKKLTKLEILISSQFIKPLLLAFLLIEILSFSSCKDDEKEIIEKISAQNTKPESEVLYGDPYDCDDEDAISCTEPFDCICYSPTSSCCDRVDLDPCNYDNMGEYADAVACELTKVINGCTQQGWPNICEMWETTICVKNILTPPTLTAIYPNATPFRYCDAADCGEFYCDIPTSLPIQHIYMTIAYQNALIAYARQIANLYKPDCGEDKTAYYGRIIFKSCTTSDRGCDEEGVISCYDKELRLMIEYYCCENGIGS